jgi:hypothetical protein
MWNWYIAAIPDPKGFEDHNYDTDNGDNQNDLRKWGRKRDYGRKEPNNQPCESDSN